MSLRHSLLYRLCLALLCLGSLATAGPAAAGPEDALKVYLEKATAGLPGRVEIVIGSLDDRLKLAPCGRVEPYIPNGMRLWGKGQLGLRCIQGASWSVFLPIEIKVYGQALVAARALPFGQNVGKDDVAMQEVEFTKEAGVAVTDPKQLEGKAATRMIAAGQVLRQEYFRAPPAVGAGDAVKVVYTGEGFNISTNGRAMGSASEGQPVRVQTEAGRVVQGIARAGRVVEMRM
jgi:flagella basal body P-ring formation protein FlgA